MPFLIDGHNLIGQTPGLRLDDPDDEQKLIELLRNYLARVRKKGAVIFDRGLPGGAAKWSSAALEVRFAPAPKTADDLILERLRREKNPRGLTVVTSDRDVANAARHVGASVKDSAVFAREMLAPPPASRQKESGLSAAEVEAWEEEFKREGRS
jgi:predicted RNA-binding protein with PIN domain